MLSQYCDSIHFQSCANAQITLESRKSDPSSTQVSWMNKAKLRLPKNASLKRLQIAKNLCQNMKYV